MIDLIVIGGGASGLAAAINAKRKAPASRVAVIEALERVGKKILATGNGRCNLSNINSSPSFYNNDIFVTPVFKKYCPEKILDFFRSAGLLTVTDSEGRVYPMSNTANSVLDCLRFEAENIGVEFITGVHINSIRKDKDYFVLNDAYKSKKVIVATGGKASPSQGSDGSGYDLLKQLGHTITKTYPALVQLTVKEKSIKSLKGVRVKADVRLCDENEIIDTSNGEVLFTDYGLSGIAIMDISRKFKNRECFCYLDLLPKLSENEIVDFIKTRRKNNPNESAEDILCGVLPRRLANSVLKKVGEFSETRTAEIIKNFRFTVNGTKGFQNAQITVGGVETSEFNPQTLESNKVKGLFCCGEILDIDSVCGGFNLQWAWASGLTAGENAI